MMHEEEETHNLSLQLLQLTGTQSVACDIFHTHTDPWFTHFRSLFPQSHLEDTGPPPQQTELRQHFSALMAGLGEGFSLDKCFCIVSGIAADKQQTSACNRRIKQTFARVHMIDNLQ